MQKFISSSPAETEQIAAEFAKTLRGGEVLAFRGGLGMGKTCFTRGLAAGLGIDPTEVSITITFERLGDESRSITIEGGAGK